MTEEEDETQFATRSLRDILFEQPLMSIEEVAPYFRISAKGMRTLVRDGRFPVAPIDSFVGRGGRQMFRQVEVAEALGIPASFFALESPAAREAEIIAKKIADAALQIGIAMERGEYDSLKARAMEVILSRPAGRAEEEAARLTRGGQSVPRVRPDGRVVR